MRPFNEHPDTVQLSENESCGSGVTYLCRLNLAQGQDCVAQTITSTCSQELTAFSSDHDIAHLETLTSFLAQQNPTRPSIADASVRPEIIRSWIDLLDTIDRNIDPAFSKDNPAYHFTMDIPPPLPSAGPEEQKAYEQRRDENQRRATASLLQVKLRLLDNKATWIFKGIVISNCEGETGKYTLEDAISRSTMTAARRKDLINTCARRSLR